MRVIDLDRVYYLQASGNYTDFHYDDGSVRSELMLLSDAMDAVEEVYARDPQANPFRRVGRSYAVHMGKVESVNSRQGQLMFDSKAIAPLSFSKNLLKEARQMLAGWIQSEQV